MRTLAIRGCRSSQYRGTKRRERQTLPLAERSGMGARGSRRRGKSAVPLGRCAAGDDSRLRETLEAGAGTSGFVRAECLRSLQSRRQRARVVRRLVRRGLLRELSGTESARTEKRHAAGFARWFVAAPY